MRRVISISVMLIVLMGFLATAFAGELSVLRPAGLDADVKPFKSIHDIKGTPKAKHVPEALLGPAGIIDTLTWRNLGASDLVNFGFLNPGDSLLCWLDPPAACSLVAIRFRPINYEGNMLLDIWDARNYDPVIYSTDSTDADGWWGTYEPITCASCYIPGDVADYVFQ